MKREIELKRRLRSLQALREAVGALKSLSAHHFRDARKAVAPARDYREGVERIARLAGAALPKRDGASGLLVVGAELGLCGNYNARMVEAAAKRRAELPPGPTLCVGHRAATLLGRRKVDVERVYAGPSAVLGITPLLLTLAQDVLTLYASRRLSSFDIVSSRFAGVGSVDPVSIRLLPFESEPSGPSRELRYTSKEHLAFAAIRELLFIVLYDLLVDALASEHGARLVATEAAEEWLEQRTANLRRHLAATRREASTQEVIEIAAGARARQDEL